MIAVTMVETINEGGNYCYLFWVFYNVIILITVVILILEKIRIQSLLEGLVELEELTIVDRGCLCLPLLKYLSTKERSIGSFLESKSLIYKSPAAL